MNIMNYEVFTGELSSLDLSKKQIINTINPHSYVTAKQDFLFDKALHSSDILIPDGSGIVLAAKTLHNKKIKKVAGANLHQFLLEKMNEEHGRIFYMGASKTTLKKIYQKITTEYPNITIQYYSPPFKEKFSEKENKIIIDKINRFNPNILFIGMTAPKQEKWLYEHKEKLNFKVASSIGAVFDFYVGVVPRPSPIWIEFHLEWFLRFLCEPKRLWKRNFISTPKFLFDLLLYRVNYLRKINYS